MRTNQAGIDLIKSFESLSLKAYLCPADVLTIGWGHTGPDVVPGLVITREEAERLFLQDLARFEAGIDRLVRVPIMGNQFSALVSFAFNVGLDEDKDILPEGLGDSTLLKKINACDFYGAADEFLKWNKSGGVVLNGLVRRRAAERDLFLRN